MRKRFLWIVFFGLLIRFGVLFLDFAWDVHNHMSWAADLWDPRRGFTDFYQRISAAWFATMYPNYPPLSMYMFYLILPLQKLIESIVWQLNLAVPAFPSALVFFVQSRIFAAGLFKLPAIAGDIGLAFVLYRFAQQYVRRGNTIPLFAASAVLLNPAFFYNSAYWGQIDAIPLLFAVCAAILLINKKRPAVSALLMTVSLLFKPTTIIFIPYYAYFFYRQFGGRTTIRSILISAAAFFIAFIPFVPAGSLLPGALSIYGHNILAAQSLKYATNGAFNLWALIAGLKDIPDTNHFILNITYQHAGIILTAIWFGSVLFFTGSVKNLQHRIPFVLSLCSLGTFIFLTRMHERYTILPLPFLIMAAVHNKRIIPVFLILSAVSFLNLYNSWPVPKIGFLYAAVSHPIGYSILSLIWIITSVYLLFIKQERKKGIRQSRVK